MNDLEQLIEDYQRKLVTIQKEIDKLNTNCPDNPTYARLTTKQGCYRTFLTELERLKNK